MTTTILRKGPEKIMNLFYENQMIENSFYLRDIARKTSLNENSASRFLSDLEKSDILSSKKDGNRKSYFVVRNQRSFAIFALFAAEKYEKLDNIRKRAIKIFLDKLSVPPIFAILFGSTAKNNYTSKSDIDIILVSSGRMQVRLFPCSSDTIAETFAFIGF